MQGNFSRLIRYRELLWNLAIGEFKARHRQTFLGVAWALLHPVSMMLVFAAVFSVFARIPVQGTSYVLFAYIGLVSWLFFANSLTAGLSSIVSSMSLITKVGFPREVIPLSRILTTGFDFLVGLAMLVPLLVVYDVPPSWALLAVPGIVAVQLVMTTGLMLALSAAYVLKRDLGSLLPLALQIGMFLSPVVYPVSVIPERYQVLYLLNPMASLLEAYRSAILFGIVPSWTAMAPALLTGAVSLAGGYAYFKAVETRFADVM